MTTASSRRYEADAKLLADEHSLLILDVVA